MRERQVERSIFIVAQPDIVWPFLVDKDKLGMWYHPADADLEQGQSYSLIENGKAVIWGKVIELVPLSKLVTTFNIASFEGRETTLTWTLHSAPGGTKVSLRHDGIGSAAGDRADEMIEFLNDGWRQHLDDLKTSVHAPARSQ